jgi:hypothetical protein
VVPQLEVARKRSGIGLTEIVKNIGSRQLDSERQRDSYSYYARRTKDLLKLNRDQLRRVVGLLTGQCHLKGHLFKLGLTNDPICERFLEEDESATHILCDCEALAHIRFCHLGQFFVEPNDYYDTSIDKVLHIIRGVGLIKG